MIHVLEIKQIKTINSILKWLIFFEELQLESFDLMYFYLIAFTILIHVEILIVHDLTVDEIRA